jgi:hypothetical protein
MANMKLAAIASIVASMLSAQSVCAAAVDVLTMTEYTKDSLGVVASFAAIPAGAQTVPAFNFSGTVTFPGNDTWTVGNLSLLIPSDTYDGIINKAQFVAWREPGNSALYNLLRIHPDGNQGYTYFEIYSDLTLSGMNDLGFNGFAACRTAGAVTPCPILNDGESYDVPVTRLQPNFGTYVPGAPMRVTFTDLGDVASAVPEPSTWAMMLMGLAGLGFAAFCRKSKAGLMSA